MWEVSRREFIALLGGGATWPFAVRAQQPSTSVVGLLSGNHFEEHELAAIRKGLAEAGFSEGRNLAVEYRSADGQYSRLPTLAAELVRRPVGLIMAIGGKASAIAAKAATNTVPIVFANGSDPVKDGLVVGLNRPGGNATGVSFLNGTVSTKRMGLLHELVPQATTVAVLVNQNNPNGDIHVQDATAAADAFKLKLIVVKVGSESEFAGAFERCVQQQVGALTVAPDAFFNNRRDRIVQLAARHKLVTMYDERDYVVAGGLIGYGASRADAYRQAAIYAGRILKGDKAADLPVMQATRFDLFINLKTAKALDLEIPPMLLARADEEIE
jgi:putative ABC transport system substrate-binding protein